MRRTAALLLLLGAVACDRHERSRAEPTKPKASARLPEAPPPPPPRPHPKNLLLITVDALRADMPWLGYPRDIAPNLTRIAKRSVVYTHAYALSSYTSMSLAGLMTGRYPSEIPRDGRATSSFGEEATMLAEVLQKDGFVTIGVHGHVYFLGATGINQGFSDWRVLPRITTMPARDGHVTDDKLADMMIEALDERAKEKEAQRFFAWVHFMDPHFSYARHEGYPRFTGAPSKAVPPGVKLDEIGQGLRNQYDGEVVFTDAQVGRLVDHVRAAPWGKDTAIVVTADHGEAFGEHKSYFEHGFLLYDVTTRVPLLFDVPGVKAGTIDARRSHIDLARTLFELLGQKAPQSFRGKSLVPELVREVRPGPEDVIIDMPYTDQTPRRRALIHKGKKLVVTETDPEPLLFDLDRDPGEQEDLTPKGGPLLTDMQARWKKANDALPDFDAPRRSRRQY